MRKTNEIKARFLLNFTSLFKFYFYFTMFVSKIKGQKPVKTFDSLIDAKNYIDRNNIYRYDKIDSIFHPRRVQHNIDKLGYVGDCDDFAIYWASILLKSKLAKDVSIGSCYYERSDGSFGGHSVCIFRDNNGKLYWADYNRIYDSNRSNTWYHNIGNVLYGKRLVAVTTLQVKEITENDDIIFGKIDKYIFTKED